MYDETSIQMVLLEELLLAWEVTLSHDQIGRDIPKVEVLMRVAEDVPNLGTLISQRGRDLYRSVFLRDLDDLCRNLVATQSTEKAV